MALHKNLIDGEWTGGDPVPNINPSNVKEVVGEYARATAEDAGRAIAAAKAAFPAWSRSGPLQRHDVLKKAADAIVELQSYGVAATADKFLEQIKQEVAESKAAVEVATGQIDTGAIARERNARKLKAAGILQQFEAEMGISAPPTATGTTVTPSVGGRVPEKPGS